MLFLVALYAVASGVAVFYHLSHYQFVAAFLVAFMCAAAYLGGRELKGAVQLGKGSKRIGRIVIAAVLLVIAWYLSDADLYFFFTILPALYWAVFGAVTGFLTDPVRNPHPKIIRKIWPR